MEFETDPNCPFCKMVSEGTYEKNLGSVVAFEDIFPVTPGHTLIIPLRHTRDYFTLTDEEHLDITQMIYMLKEQISAQDPEVTGFNIGINCGSSAGQTVFHAHMHLIPRRHGDTDRPHGGVRGVIPCKQSFP